MAALVEAAQEAGVERFVYVSYAGVDAGLGFPLERAKLATERRLGASSMQVTVVRPDAFQAIHVAPLGRFDMQAGKVAVFGSRTWSRRAGTTRRCAREISSHGRPPSSWRSRHDR